VAAKKPTSKYDPAMCDRMIELGKQGASQKMMWSDIGISKTTADDYKKKYPEFAEALDLALVHSQAYWERLMLENAENKNFNTRMVEVAVRGQFQDTYRETKDTKIDLKAEIKIDYAKEINDLLKALKS
jgi:hypothetical protein